MGEIRRSAGGMRRSREGGGIRYDAEGNAGVRGYAAVYNTGTRCLLALALARNAANQPSPKT